MQAQAEVGASCAEDGLLISESCFSTASLPQAGQLIFSREDSTIVSNGWVQARQLYSKMGMIFTPPKNKS